jgi:hypothetical protein
MKALVLLVPSLIPFCFAAALHMSAGQAGLPITKAERDAQIAQLRSEHHLTAQRLSALESSGQNFVPR